MEGVHVTTIYVLPTEEGMPPRAMLGHVELEQPEDFQEEELSVREAVARGSAIAIFSNDMGCWTVDGQPVAPELSEAISAHAASLGVPGF